MEDDLFDDIYSDYRGNIDITTFAFTYTDVLRSTIVDTELEDLGGWADHASLAATRSIILTTREKILREIRRQITLPVYEPLLKKSKINFTDIIIGLQSIERLEFYNPDALVAAAVFKSTRQYLNKESITNFERVESVSDYNLYRYYRFLDRIEFKPRHT